VEPSLIAWMLLLGAIVGFLAGLLGIGGGMLMVPFMSMLLHAQGFALEHIVKVAIATSLTTIVFTSISSVRAHHRKGSVRWDVVRTLAPGIVVGSLAGAQVAAALRGAWLATGFGLFLVFMATQMLRQKPAAAGGRLPGGGGMFGMGTLIGGLSALLGAGGGFLTVPFLTRGNVPIQQAVGTSAACGFPIAVAGTVGYVWAGWNQSIAPGMLGYVYLPALGAVVAASMLTAPLGVRSVHALPAATAKKLFAGLLYALATYMLWKAITGRAG
jgi:uncharacterized membrane protein YfcA